MSSLTSFQIGDKVIVRDLAGEVIDVKPGEVGKRHTMVKVRQQHPTLGDKKTWFNILEVKAVAQ